MTALIFGLPLIYVGWRLHKLFLKRGWVKE